MNTQALLARKIASSEANHQQRIRKIAAHVLTVADRRVKTAGADEILGNIKGHISMNPGAYIGGAAGAAGGAAIGAATGGKGKRVGRAILGAILGGGAGAGIGHGVDRHNFNKAITKPWPANPQDFSMAASKDAQDLLNEQGVDKFNFVSDAEALQNQAASHPRHLGKQIAMLNRDNKAMAAQLEELKQRQAALGI